jgi:DNA-directed RNA polymerase specialized sigma subunit
LDKNSNNSLDIIPNNFKTAIQKFLSNDSDVKNRKFVLDEARNKLTFSGEISNFNLNLVMTQYNEGLAQDISIFEKKDLKKDYKETIAELRKEGHKQKDIARMLGVSESYVSKLKQSK